MQTAREMTRTSQKFREVTFDLPHSLPPGQDRFNHPRARRAGPVLGVARGYGKRAIAPMHDYVRRVNFTNKPRL